MIIKVRTNSYEPKSQPCFNFNFDFKKSSHGARHLFTDQSDDLNGPIGKSKGGERERGGRGKGGQSLLLGAEVSCYEGPKCLDQGTKCLFQKGRMCPIRPDVIGAEVVGAKASTTPSRYHHYM